MEQVAGRAEALSKEKVTDPPPPFRERQTESIYTKVYATNGKDAREKRAKQRDIRQSAVEKLGEKEYRKLIQEVDFWKFSPADMDKMINMSRLSFLGSGRTLNQRLDFSYSINLLITFDVE